MTSNSSKKPQRGLTEVASRFNGWYSEPKRMRAFRYATSNHCRVPTARTCLTTKIPAVETAGYPCLMPTASAKVAHN